MKRRPKWTSKRSCRSLVQRVDRRTGILPVSADGPPARPSQIQQAGSLSAETGWKPVLPPFAQRTSDFLTHPVFNTHHTETEMLRYLKKLESRDLSLTTSMIPLGSCTMKLNATAEMFPISWPEISKLHPFAPNDQTTGYREMCEQLEDWLAEITGFAAVSLQPNAGSQGEYAGLARDPRISRFARRSASQCLHYSHVSTRDQSGERGHGRVSRWCRSRA